MGGSPHCDAHVSRNMVGAHYATLLALVSSGLRSINGIPDEPVTCLYVLSGVRR